MKITRIQNWLRGNYIDDLVKTLSAAGVDIKWNPSENGTLLINGKVCGENEADVFIDNFIDNLHEADNSILCKLNDEMQEEDAVYEHFVKGLSESPEDFS